MQHTDITSSFQAVLLNLLPVFTAPSAQSFLAVAWGWVLCLGRPTMPRIVRCAGARVTKHVTSYNRLFSKAAWDMDALWRLLLTRAVVPALAPKGPLLFAADDTTTHRCGRAVAFAGWFRDAVRSGEGREVQHWSHCWVLLCLHVRLPLWPRHVFSLPVMAALYRKAEDCDDSHPFRTRQGLLLEMLAKIRLWLPDRKFGLVADGAYPSEELVRALPRHAPLATPGRLGPANSCALPPATRDASIPRRPQRPSGLRRVTAPESARVHRVRTPEEVVRSLFHPEPRPAGEAPASARPRPEHKRVWASVVKEKEEVIAEMAAEMRRRDPRGEKRHVVATDGERALQHGVEAALPGVLLVLDFLHVLEYLWKAAYVFHAEGSPEAAAWVEERALRILRGAVSQVVKGLRQSVTKRGLRGPRRATLLKVAAYFHRNRRRMRYDQYLAAGLPIASGAVEGACRNLIKDRMERSGMRWTLGGAEAMVKLRVTYVSGDLDEYWAFHLRQDQDHLHPPGRWEPAPCSVEK